MDITNIILSKLYCLPGIIIGLSFHEFAHAYAANLIGDPTAKNMGRMTLNPMAHLDVYGFISLLIFGFGWAKPVPVNPRYFKKPVRDDIFVSLAGIIMNLILGFLLMFALCVGVYVLNITNKIAINIIYYAAYINISLMVFNLVPVPPLDGSHVLEDLLVRVTGPKPFMLLRKYSTFILIGILLLSFQFHIFSYPVDAIMGWLEDACYAICTLFA